MKKLNSMQPLSLMRRLMKQRLAASLTFLRKRKKTSPTSEPKPKDEKPS